MSQISPRAINSYGLRNRLTKGQKANLQTLSPLYCLQNTNLEEFCCSTDHPIFWDIGFGDGRSLQHLSQLFPHNWIIGSEVYPKGVALVTQSLHLNHIKNVRILREDAVQSSLYFPENRLSAVHIFFPDPWPKRRHEKRRLLHKPFALELWRVLRPGGYVYFITDKEEYAHTSLAIFSALSPQFYNCFDHYAPPCHPYQVVKPLLKYEQKALQEGHSIYELLFRKSHSAKVSSSTTSAALP